MLCAQFLQEVVAIVRSCRLTSSIVVELVGERPRQLVPTSRVQFIPALNQLVRETVQLHRPPTRLRQLTAGLRGQGVRSCANSTPENNTGVTPVHPTPVRPAKRRLRPHSHNTDGSIGRARSRPQTAHVAANAGATSTTAPRRCHTVDPPIGLSVMCRTAAVSTGCLRAESGRLSDRR
jgi:hypothetical protein